jgi:hypothetical protein
MGMIDSSLRGLDETTRQRVLGWANAKYSGLSAGTEAPAASGSWTHANQPNATTSMESFLAAKKPESYYERVACLAYYLEKIAGRADLKTLDITRANAEAHLSKLPNPAFVYHAASSYGFLMRLGGGRLTISKRGQALVEALPDRAKVRQALEQYPFRRALAKR